MAPCSGSRGQLGTLARTMPVPRLLGLDFLGFSPQPFLATQPVCVQWEPQAHYGALLQQARPKSSIRASCPRDPAALNTQGVV